jgi:NTE family protein
VVLELAHTAPAGAAIAPLDTAVTDTSDVDTSAADTSAVDTLAVNRSAAHAPAARSSTAHEAARSPRPERPWALVLSGGIARGFAHAGVMKALEEEHVRPDLVVGASMGGLVGAMYCAGYSPDSIRAVCGQIPWDIIFSGTPSAYPWRGLWPRAWIELVSGGSSLLQIPASIVDNVVIDEVLTEIFLNADAASQGDFDRLPIPFRTIGTDVRTGRWVMLDHGSLARACRITCGLPLMFPPVAEGSALLVDGGMSSNLPISPARAAGAKSVLAVDVALPYPELDESSSGLVVFLQLWDILNKRGQTDTISVAAGDTLLWLRLPESPAADFSEAPHIIDEGYAESGETVRSWARRSGLSQTDSSLTPPAPRMPPLAKHVEWHSTRPVQRTETAHARLGKLPTGAFQPAALVPSFRQLSRSGLFESAWPTLTNRGDSTLMSFEVRERPTLSLGPAFAVGNDEGARLYVGLTYRPVKGPLPAIVKLGGLWHSLGGAVQASFEPYALDYGSAGWFVRGRHHHLRRRIFEDGHEISTIYTVRDEGFVGGQIGVPFVQMFQGGVGLARSHSNDVAYSGPMLAFQTRALGHDQRSLDVDVATGSSGYARFEANVTRGISLGHAVVVTPGVRAGSVSGTPTADALVGLGGPHSLSGLHADEWLGKRMWAGSLELALEAARQARVYVAGQVGQVEDAVSGTDLGDKAHAAFGLGAEMELPVGPLRAEWGTISRERNRFDIMLGHRF